MESFAKKWIVNRIAEVNATKGLVDVFVLLDFRIIWMNIQHLWIHIFWNYDECVNLRRFFIMWLMMALGTVGNCKGGMSERIE